MAKKKVQPTPENEEIFKVDLTEDIETGTANGIRDAEKFYQFVITDFRLNSKQKLAKLNNQHAKARKKFDKYYPKLELTEQEIEAGIKNKEKDLKYTMDLCYWRSYLSTLHQNGVNGEVVKIDAPQQKRTLKDLFKDEKFETLTALLELFKITKEGILVEEYNQTSTIAAIYEFSNINGYLLNVDDKEFRDCFALHYMNGREITPQSYGNAKKDISGVKRRTLDLLNSNK